MNEYVEVEIWEFEDCIEIHYPCGCIEQFSFEEFYEMIADGDLDLIFDDDEDDEIDAYEELDDELVDLMEEMRFAREEGDYEGYAVLAEAYAVLFDILY